MEEKTVYKEVRKTPLSGNRNKRRYLHTLKQGFPTCGTRRSSRWYVSNFHFFAKTWIRSFLFYVSGFVF